MISGDVSATFFKFSIGICFVFEAINTAHCNRQIHDNNPLIHRMHPMNKSVALSAHCLKIKNFLLNSKHSEDEAAANELK